MTIATDLSSRYSSYYAKRPAQNVYPVEFVVRAFLGTYPRHAMDQSRYPGSAALDLGFGDGRNVPLLSNLGMKVSGVEISREICDAGVSRMNSYGIELDARVGRNASIPFEDCSFDYILACHSCYYVDPGTTFDSNLSEIFRVLRPGGTFVFSIPISSSYIIAGAHDLGNGHMQIRNDPYGLRNGYVLKAYDSEADLRMEMGTKFKDFAIGACRNDFFGIEEHVWVGVCQRR